MNISTGFYYDGEYSGNKGVIKISRGGGLASESFMATPLNDIIKVKNNNKSYIQKTELEPLTLPMALYFDEKLDETTIRNVKRWLAQDDFKELVFEEEPNKLYYAKTEGSYTLSHNSISSGYLEFEFITNSAYAFSRKIEVEDEVNTTTTFQELSLLNEGDFSVAPRIQIVIDPVTATDVEIFNDTTGEHFLLQNNLVNETIIIWSEYEELETSSNLRHRYDDHNGQFITLAEYDNHLRFKGKFKYLIEYQNIYL